MSSCCSNMAVCLLSNIDLTASVDKGRVKNLLEEAISYNHTNYWAYFNLASHAMRHNMYK